MNEKFMKQILKYIGVALATALTTPWSTYICCFFCQIGGYYYNVGKYLLSR